VVLGTLGRREAEQGESPDLTDRERPIVRRQVRRVVVQSAGVALVVTAVLLLLPAEVWSTNTTFYDRFYTFPGKKVAKLEIDPDGRSVDIDRANNVWPRAAAPLPPKQP
jgi:hypothetical protein